MSIEKEAWIRVIADSKKIEEAKKRKLESIREYLALLSRYGKWDELSKEQLITYIKMGLLVGMDLGAVDLREADLSGANLNGASLEDADLNGAHLMGADLREHTCGKQT